MVKRTTIIEIITVLNIILFLYTGIAKIQDYEVFIEQLGENPILAPFATAIAILLPIVEFVIVLMLVVPRWRYKGLLVTLTLMILFTGYIIALFSISTEMPCSCGGIIEFLSWKGHLAFNGTFILLDLWAIILYKRQKKENLQTWNAANEYGVSHG
ncbi:hypothetical protein A3860_31535 [Niastella vici]|uniref:Methylamine utilisation protein MauE domain-containing protein n=1 Tax=Niastella vici TaxID=1703345 RepID=A0A1V9FTY0_9BACT|nr:MauE/DoxX family redox-associated membrane protein [Niastella vici]OQP61793.1 hypothetical protein A3860_31535 [Niastella vici]